MDTLLLDTQSWDLITDANGHIAVASSPYSTAQGVACAVRLFEGELWYDTTKGVPYWGEILAKRPPLALVAAAIKTAALTVPEVVDARVILNKLEVGKLSGQIQIIDANGAAQNVIFR